MAFSRAYVSQVLTAIQPPSPLAGLQGSRITVNETIRTFSFLYERIRNAVDYKDEHLIRKAAILRILKRQLLLESNPMVVAERLVRELIAARYLPNGTLPESLYADVASRIRKLQAVSKIRAGSDRHLEWLQGIVAVEIEELLLDPHGQKAFVTFLYERLADRIQVKGLTMDETERRLQVYVACYRSLIKADDEMLGFKLLRAYLPEWMRSEDWVESPRPIAERLVAVELRIRTCLRHPLSQRFLRAVKPWSVSLAVLRDVLSDSPREAAMLLEKPESLRAALVRQAEARYEMAKTKLRRGMWRAMLYLFVTKMLVAFVVEVPVEWLVYKEVDPVTLAINLLFPPLLMLVVGLMIRVPGQENTDKLVAGAQELLAESPISIREVKIVDRRKGVTGFVFSLAYAATFLLSFGLVVLVLQALHFTWISATIFVFFLCVVSFFAFRLRLNAREVVIVEGRQGMIASLVDFLSLPILRAGQWLSRSIRRINIFLFIFDFLFEAPFKLFLTVLEEWFVFLKEKKEEIQ